jgi:hypothetical protein
MLAKLQQKRQAGEDGNSFHFGNAQHQTPLRLNNTQYLNTKQMQIVGPLGQATVTQNSPQRLLLETTMLTDR